MALSVIPFLAGAALGALAIYLYKDPEAKAEVRKRMGEFGAGASEAWQSLTAAYRCEPISRREREEARAESVVADAEHGPVATPAGQSHQETRTTTH